MKFGKRKSEEDLTAPVRQGQWQNTLPHPAFHSAECVRYEALGPNPVFLMFFSIPNARKVPHGLRFKRITVSVNGHVVPDNSNLRSVRYLGRANGYE
jgi:hypothetical protein